MKNAGRRRGEQRGLPVSMFIRRDSDREEVWLSVYLPGRSRWRAGLLRTAGCRSGGEDQPEEGETGVVGFLSGSALTPNPGCGGAVLGPERRSEGAFHEGDPDIDPRTDS